MTEKQQDNIIELHDICFAYDGEIALRYITCDVRRGETLILMGPNGSGKSTLLALLNGLIFPEEGSYRFEGHEITKKSMSDAKLAKWFHQRVGYVFQDADVQLFCSTVEEEIAFGPQQMGLNEAEVVKRVDDVIEMLGIGHLRQRAPYHLSGGEKRKVALGCILSMNPEVLVLDEPLAGLDHRTQEWLLLFLLAWKKAGRTMVIATHDEKLASELQDRILAFDDDHSAALRGGID